MKMLKLSVEVFSEKDAQSMIDALKKNNVNIVDARIETILISNAPSVTNISETKSETKPETASKPDTAPADKTAGASKTSSSEDQGASNPATSDQKPETPETSANQTSNDQGDVQKKLDELFGTAEPEKLGAGRKVVDGKPIAEYNYSGLFKASPEDLKGVYELSVGALQDASKPLDMRKISRTRVYWTETVWIKNGQMESYSQALLDSLNL